MEAKNCGCPQISDSEWHQKTFSWEGRTFFRKEVNFFFRTPLGIEEKTREAAEEIEKRGYLLDEPSIILIESGVFKGAVLIGIMPPGEESPDVVTFDSRPLISVVVRSDEPRVMPGIKSLRKYVASLHHQLKVVFIWYTSCPKCLEEEKKYTTVFMGRTG
jgi:Bacterial hydrolase